MPDEAKPCGYCPVCGDPYRLTKAGLLWHHGGNEAGVWPPRRCAGTGQKPREA